ncbi:hypothetical protein [Gracilibacillus sp. YIM 98692]|uniref:hypothetical protein n=1 Tax=Gracilibacillus sp. YIM 98692 TaxID=2663532 RepID=UPI0013D2FF6C|nr:hypothetical protein [Gracilibacillus sp. YIM 98692]
MIKHLKRSLPWSSKISLLTLGLAIVFSIFSTVFIDGATLFFSLVIVFSFILIGIIADTVGMAAATANESYFHAMASKKISGAKEAAYISKNAPVFSSFFNDVVGDISGIISGSASTAVVFQMVKLLQSEEGSFLFFFITVLLTSIVAALTVGGKAVCKSIAIYQSSNIILYTGKCLYFIMRIYYLFSTKKIKRKKFY